jgi:hypothetical protein
MEVNLIAGVSVGTLEVGHELATQLSPGGEGPLGKFMSHDLAMTASFPPTARIEVE